MYAIAILFVMFVLPVVSVAQGYFTSPPGDLIVLIGKWFVFWAVGVRLLVAGLMQTFRPSFTSSGIFGIADPNAEKLVQEIGFGNLAIGLIAALSLFLPGWTVPAALAGAVFLGLAGGKHVLNSGKTGRETVAMWSDLAVATMLAVWLVTTFISAGA